MDVTGKIALVTGGGRGIGQGIALTLAENGADVVVTDISTEDAERVADEVQEMGQRSMASRADVTDQASVETMVWDAIARFERIDILVNNAGIIAAPGWEERERANEEDWTTIYEVNVKGLVRVTEAVVPHMKERRYGKIINISSTAGRSGNLANPPYAASKAAVISYTRACAAELAAYNITVNTICPGHIWTPMWERIAYRQSISPEYPQGLSTREVFDRVVEELVPLKREQTAEDMGALAAFLASDHAKNITGQAINVNGGSRMD